MKTRYKVIMLLGITLCFCLCVWGRPVSAASEIEFEEVEFTSNKIREKHQIKINYTIHWKTQTEMVIEKIIYRTNGQAGQIPNIDLKLISEVEENNHKVYEYKIDFIIQDWQTGTMTLEMQYMSIEAETFGEKGVKVYTIPGGSWQKEEISTMTAVVFGFFTMVCVSIAAFMIIDNSKKGYMDAEEE